MKIISKIKKGDGFALLFTVLLSSIILAIGLSVASVAINEVKFETSTKDSDDAFFAADTALECALFNDKPPSASFAVSGSTGSVQCLGGAIPVSGTFPSWSFIISGLGSTGVGCAKVTVVKDNTTNPPYVLTSMVSKGYNIGDSSCNSTDPDRVERELDLNY